MSKPELGSTQPLIQWYRGSLSEVKRSGHDADHSPQSGVEVKDEWSYASSPSYAVDRVNVLVQEVTISSGVTRRHMVQRGTFPLTRNFGTRCTEWSALRSG